MARIKARAKIEIEALAKAAFEKSKSQPARSLKAPSPLPESSKPFGYHASEKSTVDRMNSRIVRGTH